jgi:general secretion pathway protein G
MKTRTGFTLIEILIVVVILGVLAAIVVPKFSSATSDSQISVLRKNLQTVRAQIGLYKHHHNETLPADVGETGEDFIRRMTATTDQEGNDGVAFGPYLERVPTNPFTSTRTVRVGGVPAGANTHAWRFDPNTGQFQSDDNYDRDNDGQPDHITF